MTEDCIFCKITSGKIPTTKIWENKYFLAFPDAHPQAEGHTLIISKKHFDSLMDLEKNICEKYLLAVQEVAKILMKRYKADSFNLIVNTGESAGQVIKHVHFHVIPRKKK